jgi:dTDP-4-amino-4,6-dideoxygalactose transaminase
MDRAADIITERQRLAKRYDDAFANLPWLATPSHVNNLEHSYQSYPCLFKPEPITPESIPRINQARNEWMDRLQKAGISTRPATHAVHMLTFYKEKYSLKPGDFPNAWAANDCSISLPLFHGMTLAEQDFVIQQVIENQI